METFFIIKITVLLLILIIRLIEEYANEPRSHAIINSTPAQRAAMANRMAAHGSGSNRPPPKPPPTLAEQLEAVLAGRPVEATGFVNRFRTLWQEAPQGRHRDTFVALVRKLIEVKGLAVNDSYWKLTQLYNLARYQRQFIRELAEFKLHPREYDSVMHNLLRFLLAEYDVPRFLNNAFMDSEWLAPQQWFIDIGRGRNIVASAGMEAKLTRRMAHILMSAPGHLQVATAIRWAQAKALGANQQRALWIAGTAVAHVRFRWLEEEITLQLMRLLVNNSEDNDLHVELVLEYIHIQLQLGVEFSMRGRKWENLVDTARHWARHVGSEHEGAEAWASCGIAGFTVNAGATRWVIQELTNSFALRVEGADMQHCVSDYVEECANGEIAVFSLRTVEGMGRTKSVATIEVNPERMGITEAKAKCNQPITDTARVQLEAWAAQTGLTLYEQEWD